MAAAKDAIETGHVSLGIEYGSTRIKAILVDEENKVLAQGTHDWENSLIDGYWTYPQDELISGLQSAYASLKANVKEHYGLTLTKLAGLGISAMMHGYLAFDKDDQLLVPFRTWRNTTTTEAAHELSEKFAFHIPERWSVSHLYQAMLNREEHVPEISWFTTLAGYAHYLLSGEHVLSIGDASGMFPIDDTTRSYDLNMISMFDELASKAGYELKIEELLPKILVAGDVAGKLTEAGAKLLDPAGDLLAGALMCAPEGDAGTGMIATNSIEPTTGNVSAGTSVFSMVVLEKELKDKTREEIDLVTTPSGSPVAMVHCNNCTSDINEWVELLCAFAEAMGTEIDKNRAYTTFFEAALTADKDAGGLISLPFVSGETVMGIQEGHPMFLRLPGAKMNLANFARVSIMSAFGALAKGNRALQDEGVRISKLYGHGGIFKTPKVAQSILAAALSAPVTVMETAGEGGAWGQAVAANYMLYKAEGESLSSYLERAVFGNVKQTTIEPTEEDIQGFKDCLEHFIWANAAEKSLDK